MGQGRDERGRFTAGDGPPGGRGWRKAGARKSKGKGGRVSRARTQLRNAAGNAARAAGRKAGGILRRVARKAVRRVEKEPLL